MHFIHNSDVYFSIGSMTEQLIMLLILQFPMSGKQTDPFDCYSTFIVESAYGAMVDGPHS